MEDKNKPTTGDVFNRVLEEYRKVDNGAPMAQIGEEDVAEAIKILRSLRIYYTKDAFLYLAAINLLNAAIKQKEFKNKLKYGFIKGKALLVAKIVFTRKGLDDIKCYSNREEKCLFFKVYGVVFSFHNVLEEPIVLEIAANARTIEWPGIRLQRIAVPLFLLAKALIDQVIYAFI